MLKQQQNHQLRTDSSLDQGWSESSLGEKLICRFCHAQTHIFVKSREWDAAINIARHKSCQRNIYPLFVGINTIFQHTIVISWCVKIVKDHIKIIHSLIIQRTKKHFQEQVKSKSLISAQTLRSILQIVKQRLRLNIFSARYDNIT